MKVNKEVRKQVAEKSQYEILENKQPGTIILQLQGCFYCAYDKSAIALADILNYKLTTTDKGTYKCGIPANVLSSRLEKIKEAGVGYIAYANGKEIAKYLAEDSSEFEHLTKDFVNLPRDNIKEGKTYGSKICENLTMEKETRKEYQEYVMHDEIYDRFQNFCNDKAGFSPEVCYNWLLDEGLKKWGY